MDPHTEIATAPVTPADPRTARHPPRPPEPRPDGPPPGAGAMAPGVEIRDTTPFVERTPVRSTFPPIADYGYFSDCHTGELPAPDGTFEGWGPPRFASP